MNVLFLIKIVIKITSINTTINNKALLNNNVINDLFETYCTYTNVHKFICQFVTVQKIN